MKPLSLLLGGISPSATLAVNDKAKALKAAGRDIVSLAGGDPDFVTPQHIVDEAFAAIRRGETHYPTPTKGIPAILEAIADKLARENDLHVDPHTDVVVTPGAKWALYMALGAITNPGDEILYLEPVWVSYPPLIQLAGGIPVPVTLPSNDNYRITADLLRAHVTARTKAIMINSPTNPTGRVMTEEERQAVATVVLEHDLYVISDEIYEKLVFDGRRNLSMGAVPGLAERTLTVNGLSKSYAMTGWRLGWLSGPTPMMKLATRLHSQAITAAATFTMRAAVAALNGPQDAVAEMRDAYQARRDFMVGSLNEMPGVECASIEGSFYLLPRFTRTDKDSVALADALLEKAGIAGTPGSAFGRGGENRLRFSIATSMPELEKAIDRLNRVVTEL